jgi:DNA invertase Pin-like site-specific DNA recombinase
MTPEARRLLHALLERTGARIDDIERRFDALERVVFEIDALEARIARLELRPPTPLGGRELQRQRVEAVLRVRAEGFSHQKVADATGVSKAGVRRIIEREGDPAPERVRGVNGKSFAAHPARNGDRPEAR